MLGTVSLSVLAATVADFIVPNIVYGWREKLKARSERKRLNRRSYHISKRRKP